MTLGSFVKTIQNIMRGDNGINGDAQRIEQMTWMLFLKVYDAKEEDWEFHEDDYVSIIPEALRWRNWAVDRKDGNVLTGQSLLDFVNNELFPKLKNLTVTETTPLKKSVVKAVFEDSNQYMKDGIRLRQVINEIDDIQFDEYDERHAFGEIYETILKSLQSAGNAGEFYTPRAVTDFMVKMIAPKLGERVADFACGTGGFLTSVLNVLEPQIETAKRRITALRACIKEQPKRARQLGYPERLHEEREQLKKLTAERSGALSAFRKKKREFEAAEATAEKLRQNAEVLRP